MNQTFQLGYQEDGALRYGSGWRGIMFRKTYAELEELQGRAMEIFPQSGGFFKSGASVDLPLFKLLVLVGMVRRLKCATSKGSRIMGDTMDTNILGFPSMKSPSTLRPAGASQNAIYP